MRTGKQRRLSRVNLRKSHPKLWYSILIMSGMGVAMLINFLFYTPTFNPYDIPKTVVAAVFGLIGLTQLMALVVVRNLRVVRITLSLSIFWMWAWAWANAQQAFAGKSSLQLPIALMTISLMQLPSLTESPVNPFTEKT